LLRGLDVAAIQLILNGLQQAARHRLFRPHGAACYQFFGRVKAELSGLLFCSVLLENVPKNAALRVDAAVLSAAAAVNASYRLPSPSPGSAALRPGRR
jgi:hypothetical protein